MMEASNIVSTTNAINVNTRHVNGIPVNKNDGSSAIVGSNSDNGASSLLGTLTGSTNKNPEDHPLLHGHHDATSTNTNTVLIAGGEEEEEQESDLFGTIPKTAGLARSGLLDELATTAGDGLFDTVDADLQAREEEERKRKKEEQERRAAAKAAAEAQAAAQAQAQAAALQRQQQLDGDMQDLSLNDHNSASVTMSSNHHNNGFYRPNLPNPSSTTSSYPSSQQRSTAQQGYYGAASYYYSTSGHATVQQPHAPPIVTAGMHNSKSQLQQQQQQQQSNSTSVMPSLVTESFSPLYGPIRVSDPLLVQGTGLFSGPPHWTYAITVTHPQPINNDKNEHATTHQARRRFRHFVALEDRLREDCPGSILPPRPEKHPTRVIEEATSRQSAQFAVARANELQVYLNLLRHHPIAGRSNVLKLFLTFPDHIGAAWPEVSPSLMTRIQEVGSSTANKFSEVMSDSTADGEDSAGMLALASSEGLRIGAVIQAVPKMEGTVSLLREQSERASNVGLELSRLIKTVLAEDSEMDMIMPIEILANGLLRAGRRSKTLVLELNKSLASFMLQYKLCRYERLAFSDRKAALLKRREIRQKADDHAKKLMMQQRSLQYEGSVTTLERIETAAAVYDECAQEANRHADEVANVIQSEVNRIATIRRAEWSNSLIQIALGMTQACSERRIIWQNAKESFLKEFPEMTNHNTISPYPTQPPPPLPLPPTPFPS